MNIKALIIDFSRVLIFANADVQSLNRLHDELATTDGYRVLEHFSLNDELLEYLRTLSAKAAVYLFTDGRLHKLPEIAPKLEGIFRKVYSAEELGFKKSQAEAYLALAYQLGHSPSELLVVDDKPSNIEAARQAGCHTHLFDGNPGLLSLLNRAD